MIDIKTLSEQDPMRFEVTIQEGGGVTQHQVSLSRATWRKLTGGAHEPQACLRAAFCFLLEREPKESILRSFDVAVIAQYFPEFESKFQHYLNK